MALTYTESSALMNDMDFRGRVKVAALHYAAYISDESGSVPAHNTRIKWAAGVFQQPDMQAMQLTPPVVMDAAIQSAGAGVSDAALQSAVENVVNKML